MFKYFLAIWNILQTFGIFYDHLVHFVFSCALRNSGFGIVHREKSGIPGLARIHPGQRKGHIDRNFLHTKP
jgi:hypothetical protein